MKILKCIFSSILLLFVLFIYAGCNVDIKSWMERQEIQYRMDYYRDVVIVDKHYDWDLLSDDWYERRSTCRKSRAVGQNSTVQ